MKKLVLLLLTAVSFAQTKYPTIIELTPASTTQPCSVVAAIDKTYAVCPQNNSITIDFGDGKGYVPIGAVGPAGPKGATGAQGPIGPVGPQGPAGTSGTFPAGFKCTSMTLDTTGVSFAGCK